jgi:hypothetical protein
MTVLDVVVKFLCLFASGLILGYMLACLMGWKDPQ